MSTGHVSLLISVNIFDHKYILHKVKEIFTSIIATKKTSGKTSYLPQVPQHLKMVIWFSLLPALCGCKVFEQFLNNATFKTKKSKFWRQGSPAGKPLGCWEQKEILKPKYYSEVWK